VVSSFVDGKKVDGFIKSPISALSFILRHCGVLVVRLTPQDCSP